jgi:hypothetical protein
VFLEQNITGEEDEREKKILHDVAYFVGGYV